MSNLVNILLIEDNTADTELIREALLCTGSAINLFVVDDAIAAADFLNQRGEYTTAVRPSVVILDLGLPIISGLDVLKHIKTSPWLRTIPVLVLAGSEAEEDISNSYLSYANCFIKKPKNMNDFIEVLKIITHYWGEVVVLPPLPDQ